MRRIGLIGGMSWYSTAEYYRAINTDVQERLGGHHSADLLVHSVDFAEIRECQVSGDWPRAGRLLAGHAAGLVAGGAELLMIGANLMHKVAPYVEEAVDVPLVHIADAVALEATRRGAARLGIVATRWVMEESFYADRLATHGLSSLVPDAADRALVDAIVFDELTRGVLRPESRVTLARIVEDLAARGAEAVVLACTELELSVTEDDVAVPVIASTRVHARRAVDLALA